MIHDGYEILVLMNSKQLHIQTFWILNLQRFGNAMVYYAFGYRNTFQLSTQIIVPILVHKLSQNLNVKSLYALKFHIYVYGHGVT